MKIDVNVGRQTCVETTILLISIIRADLHGRAEPIIIAGMDRSIVVHDLVITARLVKGIYKMRCHHHAHCLKIHLSLQLRRFQGPIWDADNRSLSPTL